MIPYKTFKVFDASDVFGAVQKRFGEDVWAEFNENYCPLQNGAVLFWIPDTNEEWDERETYEKYVAGILMDDGGLKWGESCYIHVNF